LFVSNNFDVILGLSNFRCQPVLPRVSEELNQHDLEYPDIPSIPEEEEEVEQPASPLHFQEFSPGDIERSDAAQPDIVTALPWRGILKKTNSVK